MAGAGEARFLKNAVILPHGCYSPRGRVGLPKCRGAHLLVGKKPIFTENKKGDMHNRLDRICLLAAFGAALAVYFYTAAPGAFLEDSATFSMAASTLSISQAPGFPLWLLLGKLFTFLIPHNPALATNLMSGFFGALAVALLYLCMRKVSTNWILSPAPSLPTETENQPASTMNPAVASLTALGAALVFALSQTAWLQAVRAEVYTLQLFLTFCILYAALCLPESDKPGRLFLLGAFLWGLSAAVHPLLAVSALPGLLVMGCYRSASVKNEISKWTGAVGLVLLAGTVYLFLPIRSARHPYLDWIPVDSLEWFFAVTTRYHDWGRSFASTATNISYPNEMRMASFLLSAYPLLFWIFVVGGILATARRFSRTGLAFFVLLLSNLLATLWAAVFNERNMDLLGYLSFGSGMAVLCAYVGIYRGVCRLAEKWPRWTSKAAWGVPLLAGILALLVAGKSAGKTNLRKSFFVGSMAREILETLPPRSVVVCWSDRVLCPLLYAQGSLGLRPDVVIFPSDFFAWPIAAERVRRQHPDLVFEPVHTDIPRSRFLVEAFRNFCRQNGRPVFSEVDKRIAPWDSLWPAGYLLQYRKATRNTGIVPRVLRFVSSRFGGDADFFIQGFMARQVFEWGAYLNQLGVMEGEFLQDRAVRMDGENPTLWGDLGKAHLFSGRFKLAETCFKLALAYDPYGGENYMFLAQALQEQGKFAEAKEARSEGAWLLPDKLKPMGQEDEKATR